MPPTSGARGSLPRRARSRAASGRGCRGTGARVGDGAGSCSTGARDSRLRELPRFPPGATYERHTRGTRGPARRRELDDLAEAELGVAGGSLATRHVPAGEVRKEDAEHRGLHGVEAGVRPHQLEGLLVARTVEAEHSHALGDAVVETRHESAVAEREEVLRREEAERRADAGLGDTLRSERLGRVLEDRNSELRELAECCHAPEQVHRHDRPGSWGDARLPTSSGSRFSVCGSMSAKTGVAPARAMAAVA